MAKLHNEAELWPLVRDALDYARREESATNLGTPDVWGGVFGRLCVIELKDRHEGDTLNLSAPQRQLARQFLVANLPYFILWRITLITGKRCVWVMNTTAFARCCLREPGTDLKEKSELLVLGQALNMVLRDNRQLPKNPWDFITSDNIEGPDRWEWLDYLGPWPSKDLNQALILREFLRRQL